MFETQSCIEILADDVKNHTTGADHYVTRCVSKNARVIFGMQFEKR